MFFAATYGRVQ